MNRLSSLSHVCTALALTGAMLLIGFNQGGEGTGAFAAPPPIPSSGVPNWDKNLPSDTRFTTVFPGAVRDNNTGLVWKQAPDATRREWFFAASYCLSKVIGGTAGWRLPSVVELASVHDPSLPAPFVPASVFSGVLSEGYWSATTVIASAPTNVWFVTFAQIIAVGENPTYADKSSTGHAWCVRGGMNADQY